MSLQSRQCYRKEDISAVLTSIHECVKAERFIISKNENRQENIAFINEYNLTHKKQKKMLLAITVDDFCYTRRNRNVGYEHEILYIFCPQIRLFNINDQEQLVDVYIKVNIIAEKQHVIVISFHPRNKPITYCFRK